MAEKSIVDYNFKNPDEKEKVLEILAEMKPFKKYDGDVPLEAMEKFIDIVCRKYKVRIGYVFLAFGIGVSKDDGAKEALQIPYDCVPITSDKGERIAHINGYSMYEVFAKISIILYQKIKKGEILER